MLTLPLPINTNTHHARDSYKPSAHGAYRIIRVLIGVNLYCRGLFSFPPSKEIMEDSTSNESSCKSEDSLSVLQHKKHQHDPETNHLSPLPPGKVSWYFNFNRIWHRHLLFTIDNAVLAVDRSLCGNRHLTFLVLQGVMQRSCAVYACITFSELRLQMRRRLLRGIAGLLCRYTYEDCVCDIDGVVPYLHSCTVLDWDRRHRKILSCSARNHYEAQQ